MRRPRLRLSWPTALVPSAALLAVIGLLLASSLMPYQPFTLKSYEVRPKVVCTGGKVTAHVTRSFNDEFESLLLKESWITVDVQGYEPGLPVQTATGVLPEAALKPTNGFETVPSPLLDTAPKIPGTYRVRITTEAHGNRWGVIPAIGSAQFQSDPIHVVACEENE